MEIKTYKFSVFTCGCGYTTTDEGNSAKHKKVSCGHETAVSSERFVLERDRVP